MGEFQNIFATRTGISHRNKRTPYRMQVERPETLLLLRHQTRIVCAVQTSGAVKLHRQDVNVVSPSYNRGTQAVGSSVIHHNWYVSQRDLAVFLQDQRQVSEACSTVVQNCSPMSQTKETQLSSGQVSLSKDLVSRQDEAT